MNALPFAIRGWWLRKWEYMQDVHLPRTLLARPETTRMSGVSHHIIPNSKFQLLKHSVDCDRDPTSKPNCQPQAHNLPAQTAHDRPKPKPGIAKAVMPAVLDTLAAVLALILLRTYSTTDVISILSQASQYS
jgi:hypothetical protein